MKTNAGLISRLALYALFSSSVLAACGDDDGGGSNPTPTGGAAGSGGKAQGGSPSAGKVGSGGNTPTGGKSATGGSGTGGAAGGAPSEGGAPPEGGAPTAGGPSAGAGGAIDGGAGGTTGGAEPGGAGGSAEAGSGGEGEGEGGAPAAMGDYLIYVGCADTNGTIQVYTLTRGTNVLTPGPSATAGSALSAGDIHDDRLYVSHKSEGVITTFGRDVSTGALDERDSIEVPYDANDGTGGEGGTSGLNPSIQSVHVDSAGERLYVANGAADSVYAYDIANDGDVGDLLDDASNGAGPQEAYVSPLDNFLVVPYTDSDELAVYVIEEDGDLVLADSATDLDADTGPRHVAIHPDGDWLYSVNETEGSISYFAFDDADGTIVHDETVAIPPPASYTGDLESAAIQIDPNGSFLYVASRLDGSIDGSIAIFSITQSGGNAGRLTALATPTVTARGELTRDIALSSDGDVLVAANTGSDNIAIFNVNAQGSLGFVSTRAVCDQPYFVKIVDN
jgi:6-phosphogluconolactonase